MADQAPVDWPRCRQDGCIGIRLADCASCLAHASDQERKAALQRLGHIGEIDARGVPITEALLAQILAAAPNDTDNHPTFRTARFDRARFQGTARFTGVSFYDAVGFTAASFQGLAEFHWVTFQHVAGFAQASFEASAEFTGASFQGLAKFAGASFQDTADFAGAAFQSPAEFNKASFQDATFTGTSFQAVAWFNGASFQDAAFTGASFQDPALFAEARFQRDAWFGEVTFHDAARFDTASFQGYARFDRATFDGDAEFAGATFEHEVRFERAVFEQAQQLGPLLASRGLVLDSVQFTLPVQIEAATIGMCCRSARFEGGVQFRLRWARVVLDDTDLAAPCILAGIPALADQRLADCEQRIAQAWQRLLGEGISPRPRLLSLRRANVAGLSLADVDLADCRFGGTHNLDKLRFEADVSFGLAPTRLAWDTRQVIADERTWRAQQTRRWSAPAYPTWVDDWLGQQRPGVLVPAQIAGQYRMLRKGREDSKDEPGAADFYYGEMEMRRHARRGRTSGASRGRIERGVLTAYWLVSGYGLRAWRALAWLLVVLLVATSGLRAIGFTGHRESWGSALLYTAGAVTRLVTPPDGLLTEPGQAIRLMVGLLGPILLALALLAIRGRIKR